MDAKILKGTAASLLSSIQNERQRALENMPPQHAQGRKEAWARATKLGEAALRVEEALVALSDVPNDTDTNPDF